MTTIEIPELGSGPEVHVGPEERRTLRLLGKRLRVEWLAADRARLSAAGCVGSVRLSRSLTVEVATKVPVSNILALASLAYRRLPLPSSVGEAELREGGALDWLAFLILSEIELLLARGMRQGYVEVRDELPYVRGRLQFAGMARSWTRPGLLACEFAEFLPDTPENQVLRATLEFLACSRLLPTMRRRVLSAAEWLSEVTLRPLTRQLDSQVRVTRLNAHYRPALELCRLYREGRGVEQPTGEVDAPAFLFPMAEVFESGIAVHLAQRLADVKIQPEHSVAPTSGEPGHTLTYRPDVVLGASPRRLVLDTKYANPESTNWFGTRSFRNADLYQISFYAREEGCSGVLVYPRAERDVHVTFEIAGTRCAIVTVDLTQPGLAGLDALAATVRHVLEPG